LHGEGHLAVLHLDDLHGYGVADLEEGARVLDEAPVELRDVHEAFEALLKLDEDAEVDGTGDLALDDVAYLVLVDEGCLLGLLVACALREDELAFLCVRRDDADRKHLAGELLEFAEDLVLITLRHARVVLLGELACREEALDALP